MNGINKTLYIPLYGKALVSSKKRILHDPKAEEIWKAEGFALKGKAKIKWLAYYMGMRSAVFDRWLQEKLNEFPDSVVVHAGCGMDSRCLRIIQRNVLWFDIDFPEVIQERKRYYLESEFYHMLSSDIREPEWMEKIPRNRRVILVMEGISMYLSPEELIKFLENVRSHFQDVQILMDVYTTFAAKASKYKNPIQEVGVTQVYGLDDPNSLPVRFVRELEMSPEDLIQQLESREQRIFRTVFAGKFSHKLYRLYEFTS